MKLLKSFKVWDIKLMLDNGVKHSTRMSADRCSRRLNEFARCKRRVDGDMTGEGEKFCNRLLADSEPFVTKLIEFITDFYKKHRLSLGLSEDTLWEICMEILAYIIDEIGPARNQVVDPAQEHLELYFWGMLQGGKFNSVTWTTTSLTTWPSQVFWLGELSCASVKER